MYFSQIHIRFFSIQLLQGNKKAFLKPFLSCVNLKSCFDTTTDLCSYILPKKISVGLKMSFGNLHEISSSEKSCTDLITHLLLSEPLCYHNELNTEGQFQT
jgi:hypothetical protein